MAEFDIGNHVVIPGRDLHGVIMDIDEDPAPHFYWVEFVDGHAEWIHDDEMGLAQLPSGDIERYVVLDLYPDDPEETRYVAISSTARMTLAEAHKYADHYRTIAVDGPDDYRGHRFAVAEVRPIEEFR